MYDNLVISCVDFREKTGTITEVAIYDGSKCVNKGTRPVDKNLVQRILADAEKAGYLAVTNNVGDNRTVTKFIPNK